MHIGPHPRVHVAPAPGLPGHQHACAHVHACTHTQRHTHHAPVCTPHTHTPVSLEGRGPQVSGQITLSPSKFHPSLAPGLTPDSPQPQSRVLLHHCPSPVPPSKDTHVAQSPACSEALARLGASTALTARTSRSGPCVEIGEEGVQLIRAKKGIPAEPTLQGACAGAGHGDPVTLGAPSPASCPAPLRPPWGLGPRGPCHQPDQACELRVQRAYLSTEQPRRAGQAPSGPCGGRWGRAGSCGGAGTSAPASAVGLPGLVPGAASAGTSFLRTCP